MFKAFAWFVVITAPFCILVGLTEIGFGMYVHDAGQQALGLVHFMSGVITGSIAFAFIRSI